MTNEEKDAIEGRTRRALRESKRNIAALGIEIEEYAKRLEEGAGNLRHFLSHPLGTGPTGMTSRQYMVQFFQQFVPPDLENKLREFETEANKLESLEKHIKEFD